MQRQTHTFMKSPIYIIKTLTTEKVIAMSSVSLLLTTLLNMRQILLALAIIIIIDMLTGIRKSLFVKGVKAELMGAIYSLSEIAVALACMVEIYSIYENMEAVSGNNLLKKLTFLLPKRVQKMFDSKVEIDDIQNDEDVELPPNKNYD